MFYLVWIVYDLILLKENIFFLLKGSVPLRPSEKVPNFEKKNLVHCLVSMCSSMFKLLHDKITNIKNQTIT